ncbi:DUF3888 domain-containing protein [Bacillus alkalicellulosilyticus]|uniref:DUF3888 domain-containing protein n=1 Tax=Alkalihalobacterium alkalicellulosilyticum TaxID=1912214 RepID=UPI000995E7F8|nr:DUF3888 domain-containing protein [Bacillus alkalicellulosilyticus]
MKKQLVLLLVVTIMVIVNTTAYAQTINEADTELCGTFKYALISSLREPIDKAIVQIYKDDKDAPEGLTWASYDTEILKIEQVYGVGGLYELTLKVYPYYDAHNSYGVDEVIINTEGELLGFKHLKTFPFT